MSAAFPKSQHYVPTTLLNRFCDKGRWLWVGRRGRSDVFRQRPEKAFVKKHVNTRYAYDGAPPSAEYENALGDFESNAAPVINRVVDCARRLEPIELSPADVIALQRFVFAQACRTPESQERVSRELSDDDLYSVIREDAEEVGYEKFPGRNAFFADSEWREFAEHIRHNIDASFAAGADPRSDAEWQKFAAETGIRFAVAHGTKTSFAIGSHGITKCDDRLADGYLAGAVLPIAHDVLAHVTPWPCTPGLLVLGNTTESSHVIGAVNKATAAQSLMIAGNSEMLIQSLLN